MHYIITDIHNDSWRFMKLLEKMGLKEDNQNFLLMHSIGVNVSGQIASVIAGGLILNMLG